MYHTRLKVTCGPESAEILMAEVAEAGFETFLETEDGFEAYVEMDKFDRDHLTYIKERYTPEILFVVQEDRIAKQNWNELWEKSYDPIVVEGKCLIRADFHNIKERYPYELIITPKMSFGTGHHQTTYLMIKNQMEIDHRKKRVMDVGCGTAILSVLASKLGAHEVHAFDIDEWSVSNSRENIEVNGCQNIYHQQGKLADLKFDGAFEIILANINKNVLLDEMRRYKEYLAPGGLLLLSGFYQSDIGELLAQAAQYQLAELKRDEREDWAALILVNP